MSRIFTIASNTFTEVIRQPAYLIILGCSMILLIISPYITWFVMLENLKLVKEMGLATLLLSGLFLAAFASSSAIYNEIENRTLLTIIAKPVRRSVFIIGKYLGVLAALLVAEYLLSLVLIHVVRTEITEAVSSKTDYPVLFGYLAAIAMTLLLGAYTNFFHEKPFTSSTILFAMPVFTVFFFALCLLDNEWKLQAFAHDMDTGIIAASILLLLAASLLTGIAVAASSRCSPLVTLGICVFCFFLGLFSDYLFGRHAGENEVLQVMYTLIPNLQIYIVADAVVEGRSIPVSYIAEVALYTLLYLTGIMMVAIAIFDMRETS